MTSLSIDDEVALFSAPPIATPVDFVKVVRWVCAGEAEAWERNPLAAPIGEGLRGGDEWVPVVRPGTPQPIGTGLLRLEFWVPNGALVSREEAGWLYLKPGAPAVNLRIFGPRSLLNYET